MENRMDIYEVTKKLIGPIEPVGDSHTDSVRLINLRTHLELVEQLISDIENACKDKESHESSVKQSGLLANKFIEMLIEELNE